jgi:hypothetical protein
LNFWQKGVIEKREAQVTEFAEFLKKMFGRYLSPEVMNSLIENPSMVGLARLIPIRYKVIGGKHVGKEKAEGRITRLSKRGCDIELNEPVSPLTNLKMNLLDVDEDLGTKDFYGKVIKPSKGSTYKFLTMMTTAV